MTADPRPDANADPGCSGTKSKSERSIMIGTHLRCARDLMTAITSGKPSGQIERTKVAIERGGSHACSHTIVCTLAHRDHLSSSCCSALPCALRCRCDRATTVSSVLVGMVPRTPHWARVRRTTLHRDEHPHITRLTVRRCAAQMKLLHRPRELSTGAPESQNGLNRELLSRHASTRMTTDKGAQTRCGLIVHMSMHP
jgi:hypothetical protein